MTEHPGRAFASAVAVLALVGSAAGVPPVPDPDALPLGVSRVLWDIAVPADAAPTAARVALGEKLFNDVRLSTTDTVSCATCHDPAKGFVDHKPLAEGVTAPGEKTKRHSPTVLNALFNATQFWDGRAATLEDQAKLPITNPIEMGQKSGEDVMRKVLAIPEYATAFREVFGREGTFDDLAAAIAAFERTQFSSNAPFDRFVAGDASAISASAKRGWGLFNGKARCNACHAFSTTQPTFSDQRFHNIGIAAHKTDFIGLARRAVAMVRSGDLKQIDELAIQSDLSELGRFLVTKQANDVGAFKTPGLRDVAITAPYMHDGSLATLWDVMDHYNKGGVPNPNLDGGMQRLGLTEPEIDDMVAFMESLTSEQFAAFGRQEMARQRGQKNKRPERDTAVAMGKKGNMGDLGPPQDPAHPAAFGVLVLQGTSYGERP
jgi:cytochrome c peroxidase